MWGELAMRSLVTPRWHQLTPHDGWEGDGWEGIVIGGGGARAARSTKLLLYSKVDPETTARVIDDALAATPDASGLLRVQAQIMRADAAHSLGDDALAAPLLAEAAQVALGTDERASIADDLARAEELRLALA